MQLNCLTLRRARKPFHISRFMWTEKLLNLEEFIGSLITISLRFIPHQIRRVMQAEPCTKPIQCATE